LFRTRSHWIFYVAFFTMYILYIITNMVSVCASVRFYLFEVTFLYPIYLSYFLLSRAGRPGQLLGGGGGSMGWPFAFFNSYLFTIYISVKSSWLPYLLFTIYFPVKEPWSHLPSSTSYFFIIDLFTIYLFL
jgi:hypothetical protein